MLEVVGREVGLLGDRGGLERWVGSNSQSEIQLILQQKQDFISQIKSLTEDNHRHIEKLSKLADDKMENEDKIKRRVEGTDSQTDSSPIIQVFKDILLNSSYSSLFYH